jgi:hypothetical protein
LYNFFTEFQRVAYRMKTTFTNITRYAIVGVMIVTAMLGIPLIFPTKHHFADKDRADAQGEVLPG